MRVWAISEVSSVSGNYFLDSYAFGGENGCSASIPGVSIRTR